MPTNVKVGGTQRNVSNQFVKVNNAWRNVTNAWVKVAGVWRETYSDLSWKLGYMVSNSGYSGKVTKDGEGTVLHTYSKMTQPYNETNAYLSKQIDVTPYIIVRIRTTPLNVPTAGNGAIRAGIATQNNTNMNDYIVSETVSAGAVGTHHYASINTQNMSGLYWAKVSAYFGTIPQENILFKLRIVSVIGLDANNVEHVIWEG